MDPYYPLKEGRRFVYRYLDAEQEGEASATRLCRAVAFGPRAVSCVWDVNVDGPRPWTRSFKAARGPEGIVEDERWILRPPVEAGTEWRDGADAFRIASAAARVEVPAGEFADCLEVVFGNEDTGGGSLFFAPGVGLVRLEQRGERGGHRFELVRVEG